MPKWFVLLFGVAVFAVFFAFTIFSVLQVMLWWGKPSWELAFWVVMTFWMALFSARAAFSQRDGQG